jgi:sulfite reductase (NADPH) hemoprotein beta-component
MYNFYLGGGFSGERLNTLYKESIDENEILNVLGPLFKEYATKRIAAEHFGDFCIRTKVV